jgi:hypothetical protein
MPCFCEWPALERIQAQISASSPMMTTMLGFCVALTKGDGPKTEDVTIFKGFKTSLGALEQSKDRTKL